MDQNVAVVTPQPRVGNSLYLLTSKFKREIICKSHPRALLKKLNVSSCGLLRTLLRIISEADLSQFPAVVYRITKCVSSLAIGLRDASALDRRETLRHKIHKIKPCAKLTLFHLISASTSSGNPASSLLLTSLVLSSSQFSRLLISLSSRSPNGKASRNA